VKFGGESEGRSGKPAKEVKAKSRLSSEWLRDKTQKQNTAGLRKKKLNSRIERGKSREK